jgi:hypothetical protein
MFVIRDVETGTLYRWFEQKSNADYYCLRLNVVQPDRFRVLDLGEKKDVLSSYETDLIERKARIGNKLTDVVN